MKKALTWLMSVLVAGLATAASVPTTGTSVGGPVIPQGSFPSHAAYYGHGGWRSVVTTNDLSLIDSTRMETGMAAFVTSEAKLYVYTGSNWTEFAAGASTPSLQAVTGVGNTTSNGLVVVNAGGYTSFVSRALLSLANNNNTVSGDGAGNSLSSGINNTLIGKNAGYSLANGNFNTIIGNEALYRASASSINTAIGDWALHELTNGNYNTAIGAGAMKNVPIGADNHVIGPNIMADGISVNGNIGIGYIPIRNLRYGDHNIAFGSEALRWVYSNAVDNVAIGRFSLWNLGQTDFTNCSRNVAVGPYAGYNLTGGSGNIFLGYYALASGTSVSNEFVAGGVQQPIRNVYFGSGPNGTVPWTLHGEVATGLWNVVWANTVIVTNRLGAVTFIAPVCPNANGAGAGMTIAGTGAGALATNADNLTVYGATAGASAVSGANNTFIGAQAGFSNTNGGRNTFVGQSAGYYNESGQFNVFIGKDAGQNNYVGSNMVFLGVNSGGTPGKDANICIGRDSRTSGANATNEFVAGSDVYPTLDVYFGGGPGSTKTWTLHGEYASGLFLSLTEGGTALSNKYARLGTDNTYAGDTIQNFALATVTNNASASTDVVNWRTMTNYVAGVTPASPNLQSVTTVGNLTSNGMIVVTAGGKTSLVVNAASSTWAPAQGGVPEPRPTSTLIGYNVGGSMTSAVNNTLIGYEAGRDMQGGEHNVMVGDRAGVFSTNADENVFVGQSAGYVNKDGWYNVYVGREAGENNSGSNNTAVGHHAGRNGVYPSANPAYHNMTILGDSAGETTPGLRDNILMGVLAQASGASATNEFVAGSATVPMLDVYFGGGPGSVTPWTLHGEYASGLFLSLTEGGTALSNKYARLGTDNTYAGGTIQSFALATVTNNASASTDVVNWRTMTNYVAGSGSSGFLKADGSVTWTGNQNAGNTIITNLGGFWLGGILVTNIDTNAVSDLEASLLNVSNRVVTLEGLTNTETLASVTFRGSNTTANLALQGNWISFGAQTSSTSYASSEAWGGSYTYNFGMLRGAARTNSGIGSENHGYLRTLDSVGPGAGLNYQTASGYGAENHGYLYRTAAGSSSSQSATGNGAANYGAVQHGSQTAAGGGSENHGAVAGSSSSQYAGNWASIIMGFAPMGVQSNTGVGSLMLGSVNGAGAQQIIDGLGTTTISAFSFGKMGIGEVQYNSADGGVILGGYGTNTHDYAVLLGKGLQSIEGNAVHARKYFENGTSLDAKYATYPAATNIVNGYIVGSGYMYMTENVGTSILYHVTLGGTHTNKIGEYYSL